MRPPRSFGFGIGWVYIGCGVLSVTGLVFVLGWSSSVDLIGYLTAHEQWRLLTALILLLLAPVLALAGLLLARKHPRWAWLFVLGVVAGFMSVCLVVPPWTDVVPSLAWWAMGVAAISGLTATYLLVARAIHLDDRKMVHVR